MSDYLPVALKYTNMSGKDADPSVFDVEFNTIKTAVNSKMNKSGGAFSGAITVPSGATGAQAISATDAAYSTVPVNTVMAFFQPTAPTGWVQVNTHNDAMLRIVNNTGVGGASGGSASIAAGIIAGITGGHALSISEMPAHTHTAGQKVADDNAWIGGAWGASNGHAEVQAGVTQSGSTGSGAAHTHTTPTWQPKYINMIICSKQ